MSINNFLNKENINTLWDVISDEDIFKFLSRDIQSKIAELFSNNIKGFFEKERIKKNSLVDINKKYILLILNHIQQNYTQQIPNKIKILDESPVKETITYEEIQNERKTQFEKDLMKKQEEFENIITKKIPPLPEFADKYDDKPISEMENIIKEITAKRNYDVEQINKNNNFDESWLKPQETSIKTEKLTKDEIQQPLGTSRLKYLNIDDQEEIPTKKTVTWENNRETTETEIEENIFKKLKKIENTDMELEKFNNNEKNDDKIRVLEYEIKMLNYKLDMIIELLKK
jgi:hypothetical protein